MLLRQCRRHGDAPSAAPRPPRQTGGGVTGRRRTWRDASHVTLPVSKPPTGCSRRLQRRNRRRRRRFVGEWIRKANRVRFKGDAWATTTAAAAAATTTAAAAAAAAGDLHSAQGERTAPQQHSPRPEAAATMKASVTESAAPVVVHTASVPSCDEPPPLPTPRY